MPFDKGPTSDTPSTRAIFLGGGKKLLAFTIGWLILDAVWWHGRHGISWPLELGGTLAVIEMAVLYRRAEWRQAVAPEHMLGAGFCAAAYVVATLVVFPDDTPRFGLVRITAVALLLVAPVFLMMLAARELLLKRVVR